MTVNLTMADYYAIENQVITKYLLKEVKQLFMRIFQFTFNKSLGATLNIIKVRESANEFHLSKRLSL